MYLSQPLAVLEFYSIIPCMNALITTMIKILVCMAIGFSLKKINILNDASTTGFSSLIIQVTAPCLLFSSIVTMDLSELKNAVTLLWAGFAVYAALIILAVAITRLLKISPSSRGVYQAAMIFGNVSFLGIPLAESLYGATGVFYIALLNIHFNLLFFSYGYYLILSSRKNEKFNPKRLVNTGIISILLAIIIYFCGITVPDMVVEPIRFVGSITSPLSMIIIGSSAASYSLKEVFSQKKIYILSFLRLLVYPIAAYFIFKYLIGDNLLTRILCIYIGMPTASVVGMTAITYDCDAHGATSCTAMMTILSLVSIPVLYVVMSYL